MKYRSIAAFICCVTLADPTFAQTPADVNAWNAAMASCAPQFEAAVQSQTNAVQTRAQAQASIGHPRRNFGIFTVDLLQEFRAQEASRLAANPTGFYSAEQAFKVCIYDARINQLTGRSPASATAAATSAAPAPSTSPQIDTGNFSRCVSTIRAGDSGAGNYGRLKNSCNFAVNVRYCNVGAPADSFASSMSCTSGGQNWGGSSGIGANDVSTALVGGQTYWYACKKPASVANASYNPGQGISASCK